MSSCGSTRLRCSVQRRSRRMPTGAIEQRMIGHMNGPPARTISHMGWIIPEAPRESVIAKRRQANGYRDVRATPANCDALSSRNRARWRRRAACRARARRSRASARGSRRGTSRSAIPPVAIANPAPLASIHSALEAERARLPAHDHHVARERAGAARRASSARSAAASRSPASSSACAADRRRAARSSAGPARRRRISKRTPSHAKRRSRQRACRQRRRRASRRRRTMRRDAALGANNAAPAARSAIERRQHQQVDARDARAHRAPAARRCRSARAVGVPAVAGVEQQHVRVRRDEHAVPRPASSTSTRAVPASGMRDGANTSGNSRASAAEPQRPAASGTARPAPLANREREPPRGGVARAQRADRASAAQTSPGQSHS